MDIAKDALILIVYAEFVQHLLLIFVFPATLIII